VETELSRAHFEEISRMVYRVAGIRLQEGKENLVRTRLSRRLQTLGCTGFSDYLGMLEDDGTGLEASVMVDLLTTNKTSFFRESQHFDFMRDEIFPALSARPRPVSIWSAGCSSGEEAYTLALLAREHLTAPAAENVKILATDISDRVLQRARAGEYSEEVMREVPAPLRHKYFLRTSGSGAARTQAWQAGPALQSLIRFARLNLMEAWPMKGPFTAIFCRNVMIYFDRPTQEKLVNRFWDLLEPGGHMFVGHSESLTALDHQFVYVQPALYRK
jgi:chemotaxis protein methyltransferase CheR